MTKFQTTFLGEVLPEAHSHLIALAVG
jgi:hypothetical protein